MTFMVDVTRPSVVRLQRYAPVGNRWDSRVAILLWKNLVVVLANFGRRASDGRAHAVERKWQPHERDIVARHWLQDPDRLGLRLGQYLGQTVDRRARRAGSLQKIDPFAFAAREQDLLDLTKQFRLVGLSRRIAREARLAGPLGASEHAGQLGEEPVVAGGDEDRPRLGLEGLKRDEPA